MTPRNNHRQPEGDVNPITASPDDSPAGLRSRPENTHFRKAVDEMEGYTPGEQPKRVGGWIKLNTNENPYPPSPKVSEALASFAAGCLRLYPDPECREVRGFLAELHGVGIDNIIAGNGSDDILTMVMRSFVSEAGVCACPDPTYSLYPVLASIQGARCEPIPLEPDFSFPANFAEKASGASLVLIPRPNAPTGTAFDKLALENFRRDFRGVVLIDEAYADFADDDCLDLAVKYPNVIVSRTLSKSYSLAGARFGYAVASEELISGMMKVKDSYNVNALTQAAALAALKDRAYFEETVAKIRATRKQLVKELLGMGFEVAASSANFVFAQPPDGDAGRLYAALKEKGILVRWFSSSAATQSRVRITVGTDDEISALLSAIRQLVVAGT
ncbi:MAG: histidinol-phosphate transaminase [Kiritimatiellaeota bacterium]|nr:histidinol-phosphate transaminase [Kiritimatiellota bacterium]